MADKRSKYFEKHSSGYNQSANSGFDQSTNSGSNDEVADSRSHYD